MRLAYVVKSQDGSFKDTVYFDLINLIAEIIRKSKGCCFPITIDTCAVIDDERHS